jgi:hypothetical protein
MNSNESQSKITTSQALEIDLYHFRAENESLVKQIAELQSQLQNRECSVYELVLRTKELAEKLNDATTENSRLNKRLLNSLSVHADIKSRFIESLRKLKDCRGMLRMSLEVSVKLRNAIEAIVTSFDSGDAFDFFTLENVNRRLRANDFKFVMGVKDYTTSLNLVEKSEVRNISQLMDTYQNALAKLKPIQISQFHLPNLNSPDIESSIQNSRNESRSINISLLKNYMHAPKARKTPSCFHQFPLKPKSTRTR